MNIEGYKAPEMADEDGLTAAEREMADYYLSLYSEEKKPEQRDSRLEIVELENLFAEFEAKHDLAELKAIVQLSIAEALVHPVREPAKKDLGPIVSKLNALKQETDIAIEKYDELQARYRTLSDAVGILNNGQVRHG